MVCISSTTPFITHRNTLLQRDSVKDLIYHLKMLATTVPNTRLTYSLIQDIKVSTDGNLLSIKVAAIPSIKLYPDFHLHTFLYAIHKITSIDDIVRTVSALYSPFFTLNFPWNPPTIFVPTQQPSNSPQRRSASKSTPKNLDQKSISISKTSKLTDESTYAQLHSLITNQLKNNSQ